MTEAAHEAVTVRQTWRERLEGWLFPMHLLANVPDRLGIVPYQLRLNMVIAFSPMDRLRLLVSGKAFLQMRVRTDVQVGQLKSAHMVDVIPPGWLPPVPDAERKLEQRP